MEEAHLGLQVQIYATDLDDEAIAVARAGLTHRTSSRTSRRSGCAGSS